MGAAALVTLAVAAVFLASSGGWIGSDRGEARSNAPCLFGAPGTGVGSITSLVHTSAYVNNNYVGSAPYPLKAGQHLCTDTAGQVLFTLTRFKTTKCNTKPNSKMRFYPPAPPANVVIRFLTSTGKSWCSAGGKPYVWYGTSVGKAWIYTSDPLFGVSVTRKESLIKDTYGFFAVYTPATRTPVLLGPMEQLHVSPTGAVTGPEPVDLTPDDQASIAELGTAVPRPNYTRPAAGNSKVLERMYANRSIRVGLDPRQATPQVTELTRRYFALLARRWGLRLTIVPNGDPSALAEGIVDVIATPSRKPGSIEVATVPYTQQGRTNWDLELLPESSLVAGFRRYVRTSLDAADYARHYRAAFGAAPSYERFRTFIFPSLPPAPGG